MSEDLVKIPKCAYVGGKGSLGTIDGSSIKWQTCRDRFQTDSDPEAVMSFVFYAPGCIDASIEFIRTIEQIINLPNDQCLTFRKTTEKDVLHVTLTPFWKYRLRRSLLTAFLRCGMSYDKQSAAGFEKSLWSYSYTATTKYAVERFLNGYTSSKFKTKNGFSGWQNLFSYNATTKDKVDAILVKVKKKKKETPQEVVNGTDTGTGPA